MKSVRIYADTCKRIKRAAAGAELPMIKLIDKIVEPGLSRLERQDDVTRLRSAEKPSRRPTT
jgi:hypothetical protein